MPENTVKAGIRFYFKGEKLEAETQIDLDDWFRAEHDVRHIYDILAEKLGIDEHRHEYDVMAMEAIEYTEPHGLAARFVQNGVMDWQGLEKAWKEQRDLQKLTPIANKFFHVENLKDDPKLAAALLEAYRLGQQVPQKVERHTDWMGVY